MTLYVRPISAFLTHDTELFSNMDPYVIAVIGANKQRSKTIQQGGKRPKWTNDVFTFRTKATSMLVTVYDEDTFSDDVVGSASVDISKYVNGSAGVGEKQQNVELSHQGKRAGTLKLSIRYLPDQTSDNYNNRGLYNSLPQYSNLPPYIPPVPQYSMPNQAQQQPYNNGWGQGWPQSAPQMQNPYGMTSSWSGPSQPPQPQQGPDSGIWKNILQATMAQNMNLQNQPSRPNNQWGNNGWPQNNNNNNGWGNGW